MTIDKSKALFERAVKVIPGGVNSPVRAFAPVGGQPRFITRAKGSYIYDEDGNKYGWGRVLDWIGVAWEDEDKEKSPSRTEGENKKYLHGNYTGKD